MFIPFGFMATPSGGGLPSELASYSVRLFNDSYSGDCLRVRRSGDDAEQDIGFSAGVLDTASMESFVTAGGGTQDGYVVTWFDQSGNGYDQTQSTAGNQPQIVSSGTTITQGSYPAISFPGTTYLTRTHFITNLADKTTFNVYYPTNIGTGDCIMDLDYCCPSTGRAWTLTSETGLRCIGRTYITTAGSNNTYSLLEMWQNGITIDDASQFKMYLNGTYEARTSGGDGDLVLAEGDAYIGFSPNGNNPFDGTQQEIVVYDSSLSDTDREAVRDSINTYYSIYP